MCKKHYPHISKKERALIEKMKRDSKSIRFIARRLDPCPSTISREIQRNSGSLQAQQISEERQQQRCCADR